MSGSHSPFAISDLRFTICIGLRSSAPSSPVLTAQKLKRLVDVMDMGQGFVPHQRRFASSNGLQWHDRNFASVKLKNARLQQFCCEAGETTNIIDEVDQHPIRQLHNSVANHLCPLS